MLTPQHTTPEEVGTKAPSRPGSEGVNALAHDLAREFDAPLGVLDPEGPTWRIRMGVDSGAFPGAEAAASWANAAGVLDKGLVALWRLDPGDGPVWLGLPVGVSGGRPLLALVGFASSDPIAGNAFWGPPCPERALRAWGLAVAGRLRAEALTRDGEVALAARPDSELPLFDRLTRRFHVSDPPERYQGMVAEEIREAMGVDAVAWVPGHPREPTVVAGGVDGLGVEGYRGLLPESHTDRAWLDNRPARMRGASIRRVAIIATNTESSDGWLVAVNPRDGRPFTTAEVEMLQPVAALVGTQRANARLYADLKDLLFGVIRALTSAIDAKDPYTSGHSERVARIAVRLGEELSMSSNQRGDLYLMGLLHDVGKIGIDDGVLKKTGPLSADEFRQIQSHVRIGVHILSDLKKLNHLLPGVAHHHESLDGTGYPSGLAGEAIPLEARILAVADAFDAMSSTRPYRRRLAPGQIVDIFRKGAGVQWDPRIVDALFACLADLEHIRQKGLGDSLQQVVNATLGRS